jgi:hypothetical protein
MKDLDAKRGAVIGAALALTTFIEANAGDTKDWPIRITGDLPEIGQFAELHNELKKALVELRRCRQSA